MYTLSLISQKGGSGKTTLACGLAVVAESPAVATAHAARLGGVLTAARKAGAQLALIDTAPHAPSGALAAARASDGVLIPCRPAAADLYAINATVDVALLARRPGAVVLNAAPVRSTLVGESLAALAGYDVEAVPVVVHHRLDHVRSYAVGLAATELAKGGKAAGELVALFEWVMAWRYRK